MAALRSKTIGVCLAVAAASLLAHADPARAADPEPPGEAKALFQRGLQAYDERDYAEALALFQRSYQLSGKAEILFDIAETYAALGECPQAVEELTRLQHADVSAALHDRATARRKELEPCSPAASAPVAVLPPPSPTPVSPHPDGVPGPAATQPDLPSLVSQPSPPPPSSRAAWRTASWTALGAAAACVAAGLAFEFGAHSAQQSVQTASVWDQGAVRQDERGRAFDTAGTALLIAGGVAVVVTAATYLMSRRFR